jgi:UDP-N-acetyl-D-galactosamine dehydrogenase
LDVKIAVVGLGYVGLPLAVEFSKKYPVIGFDISEAKINELKSGKDSTGELTSEALKVANVSFSRNPEDLRSATVFVITVPTPIDETNKPDLRPVISATKTVGEYLSKGDIVVYESTVYPGVTEDICMPLLESISGLKFNVDFFAGYSPERINPGDKERTLTKITKVVSGSTPEVLSFLAELYGSIIPAGVYKAQSIKVAEAAKAIENTQRDLNVALMNELAIIFNRLGISTMDVIDAASTKWNFMKMTPGLVGGHCIGVDPYYLTYKAEQVGYYPQVILAGRRINDSMGKYIAEQTVKQLIKSQKYVKNAKVLILGFTFKENVPDVRNTKVVDIVKELKEYGIDPVIADPVAQAHDVTHEYGLTLCDLSDVKNFDAVILAVPHKEYVTPEFLTRIEGFLHEPRVLVDIKGIFRNLQDIKSRFLYWSL